MLKQIRLHILKATAQSPHILCFFCLIFYYLYLFFPIVSFAVCNFQIHTVRGTGVLQQYVDKQQLPTDMDGDFTHCHSDWLAFRLVRVCCLNFKK